MLRLNKDSRFDIIYNGIEYVDHWNLTTKEVDDFLCDCEYMHCKKWIPIYLPNKNSNKITKVHFYHIVYTLYLHNYIVCYPKEVTRDPFTKKLIGESSLLKEVLESKYLEKQERLRKKYYGK